MPAIRLSLATQWTPARDGAPLAYALKLTNHSVADITAFRLCLTGPASFDADSVIEGGRILTRLSNFTELAPPEGFTLRPGDTWVATARQLYPLRHWSDGATAAYVILSDGTRVPVAVTPTEMTGDNAPLKKGAARYALPAGRSPVSLSIIPWPKSVVTSGARTVPGGLDLRPTGALASGAALAFTRLVADLFAVEGLVRPVAEGGLPVHIVEAAGFGPEAYEVSFAAAGPTVSATTHAGLLYGLITLGQILRGAKAHPFDLVFPAAGTISDAPALGFRGTHLDVARQFYSSAEVAKLLKVIAWNKMNRFHWHLSEDEAWRLEIRAYPELTEIGAWRGHGLKVPPLLGSGPEPTGGFYTQAAVRELVTLAADLGIAIIPEIDIPGHCWAAIQALPWLADPDETGAYLSVQSFPNNCLNPAHEPVYTFLETVIGEVLELFPAGIFHLGADEVPLAAWSGSPKALALLEELAGPEAARRHAALKGVTGNHGGADAIGGSGTAVLQAHFIRRVHEIIKSKGAKTGGWEEAAHGGAVDRDSTYLIGWRNVEASRLLAAEGYDIVVSPGQRYYLDMANSLSWSEPGAGWAGWSGPEETYTFDPRAGWSEAELQRLIGVQSCIWSEPMTDRAIFDRLVFPRLSAIAEAGWTSPDRKSWPRFAALAGLMPIMYGNWEIPEA
jgi:hexosaminidase